MVFTDEDVDPSTQVYKLILIFLSRELPGFKVCYFTCQLDMIFVTNIGDQYRFHK